MGGQYPHFASLEAGLVLSPLPVWVFVADTIRFWWANDAALKLWQAEDRDELFAREMLHGVPEMVITRTEDVVARVRAGKLVREEWIIYPRGVMTTVLLEVRGITLPDGRFGLLNHGVPNQAEMPPSILRSLAMFRHAGIVGALVSIEGEIRWRNPMATRIFGEVDSWFDWLVDRDAAESIVRRAVAGESLEQRVEVEARGQRRWHQIEANPLRDPVTTEIGALIEHVDVSDTVEAEALALDRGQTIGELSEALALVERQREAILALSAPMLEVGNATLALPLVGELDQDQSEALTAKLLDAVVTRGARIVLLDLTGLAAIDEASASRLHQLVKALELLGARPILTGIRPQLAVTLTRLGLDLGGVETLRSLADGLR